MNVNAVVDTGGGAEREMPRRVLDRICSSFQYNKSVPDVYARGASSAEVLEECGMQEEN